MPSPLQDQIDSVNGVPRTGISKVDGIDVDDIYTIDDIGNNFIQDTLPLHVGYSVRQLTTAATNCMDVRNSSGTVRTIGFVDGYLDVPDLLSHCGDGYGAVVKFYDQSPNGYHLEATQWQNGPAIVDLNGDLITRNGKAALQFHLTQGETSIFSDRWLQVEDQGGGTYIESVESEWGLLMFVGSTHADTTNYQPVATQWQGNDPSDGVSQASDPNNVAQHLTISSNKFRSLFGMYDNPDYDYSSVLSAANISSYSDYLVTTTMDTDAGGSSSTITMAVNSVSPQYTGTTPSSGSFQITQDDTYPFYLGKGFSSGSTMYYQGFMNEFVVYSNDSHQQLIPSQVSAFLTQEANEFFGVF